jgi:hypothetical protein
MHEQDASGNVMSTLETSRKHNLTPLGPWHQCHTSPHPPQQHELLHLLTCHGACLLSHGHGHRDLQQRGPQQLKRPVRLQHHQEPHLFLWTGEVKAISTIHDHECTPLGRALTPKACPLTTNESVTPNAASLSNAVQSTLIPNAQKHIVHRPLVRALKAYPLTTNVCFTLNAASIIECC